MLFPLQPNHSRWLRLSNPTGNCINHSGKNKKWNIWWISTFVNMAFQYKMPQKKHFFGGNHNLRAVKWGATTTPLPTTAITNPGLSQGQLFRLPTRKEKAVLALLWMDSRRMNNTVLSVRLGKIYIIQSRVNVLFLLPEGIQIRPSTGSYTLKCCWDQCDSTACSKTTEVCIKRAANIFNCFL